MRFAQGEPLDAVIESRGPLGESELRRLLLPLLDGMETQCLPDLGEAPTLAWSPPFTQHPEQGEPRIADSLPMECQQPTPERTSGETRPEPVDDYLAALRAAIEEAPSNTPSQRAVSYHFFTTTD